MLQHVIGFLIALTIFLSAVAIDHLFLARENPQTALIPMTNPWAEADQELVIVDRFFFARHYRTNDPLRLHEWPAYQAPGMMRWTVRGYIPPTVDASVEWLDYVVIGQEVYYSDALAMERLASLQRDRHTNPEGFGIEEWPTHQFRIGSNVYLLRLQHVDWQLRVQDLWTVLESQLKKHADFKNRA